MKKQIIEDYVNHYSDTNFKHFSEIVYDNCQIKISDNVIFNFVLNHQLLFHTSISSLTNINIYHIV